MTATDKPLTPKQQAVLEFVKRHQADHGYAPSYRDLLDAFGFKSLNAASYFVGVLKRRGYLVQDESDKGGAKARTLRVAGEAAEVDRLRSLLARCHELIHQEFGHGISNGYWADVAPLYRELRAELGMPAAPVYREAAKAESQPTGGES